MIFFAATAARQSIPLDAEPDPAGIAAAHRDAAGLWQARILTAGEQPAAHEKTFMPHWKTCKDSGAFRRRQKTRSPRAALAELRGPPDPLDPQLSLF
jgi:hypothetical protein